MISTQNIWLEIFKVNENGDCTAPFSLKECNMEWVISPHHSSSKKIEIRRAGWAIIPHHLKLQ
ncbi:hypothetical protein C1H46_005339 [Malus baccata]|uniref:Uncharacterized protein n=1 Tax=Malus baccata TaxID=106549 RepID=A0A540ND48_MALBA|nr:hypothetical protein C1H46_005339 [Malus baccata]